MIAETEALWRSQLQAQDEDNIEWPGDQMERAWVQRAMPTIVICNGYRFRRATGLSLGEAKNIMAPRIIAVTDARLARIAAARKKLRASWWLRAWRRIHRADAAIAK